jgi:hypothetical protein
MHVNRQGKDVTTQCLLSAIRNIFVCCHCDLPIILKWGEDQQDRDSDVQGPSRKRMPNGDSELISDAGTRKVVFVYLFVTIYVLVTLIYQLIVWKNFRNMGC